VDPQLSAAVPLKALNISRSVFAYDWVTHQGQLIPRRGALRMDFKDGWAYWVLSPVSPEGIALLGDATKLVPSGKQRILVMKEQAGLVTTIQFAPDERVLTISGYASQAPSVHALSGSTKSLRYHEQSRIFTVNVLPGEFHKAEIRLRP
jgi:hypothetical protein